MGREGISTRTRFQVFMRDRFTCIYCGASPGLGGQLQVDHIVPVAAGGTNAAENLATACRPCNAGKSDAQLYPEIIAEIADRRARQDAYNRMAHLGFEVEKQKRREELRRRIAAVRASGGDHGVQ